MVVFSDGFESGDTSAWTGTNGSPTVSNTVARRGTYSLQINASSENAYKAFTAGNVYYARAYFYFNGFPNANNEVIVMMRLTTTGTYVAGVSLIYLTAGGLQWRLTYRSAGSDANVYSTSNVPSANTWVCVEVMADLSSADGTANGSYKVYINGVEDTNLTKTSIDTDYTSVNRLYIGAYTSNSNPDTFYIDQVAVDTAYIGVGEYTKTFSASANLLQSATKTYSVNANLLDNVAKTFTSNASLQGSSSYTKEFTVGANLLDNFTKTFSANASLLDSFSKTFTVNGNLLDNFTKGFTVNGNLLDTLTKTFTVNSNLLANLTKTCTVNANLLKAFTAGFTFNGNLTSTTTVPFTYNANLKQTNTATFTLNAELEATLTDLYGDSWRYYYGGFKPKKNNLIELLILTRLLLEAFNEEKT